MSARASAEVVSSVLRKALPEGTLNRIPRHPDHRDIVLAVLCLGMRRRYPYAETEFNEYLERALSEFHARVDHVTCRRYMVDLGFVRRDRAGIRYLLNYPKVESVLSDEAMASARDLVAETLADHERSARRKASEARRRRTEDEGASERFNK